MIDKKTILTQINTGGATLANLAESYNLSVPEMEQQLKTLDVPIPRQTSGVFSSIDKLRQSRVLTTSSTDYTSLMYDDASQDFINGWDLNKFNKGYFNPGYVVEQFHGKVCFYSGKPADRLFPADNNPQNFLISNLVPLCMEELQKRYGSGNPHVVEKHTYKIPIDELGDVTLDMHLTGKVDATIGSAYLPAYIDAAVGQWVTGHFASSWATIAPGVKSSLASATLLIWRQLAQFALIKGLSRIELSQGDRSVTFTSNIMLSFCNSVLAPMLQSNIVAPGAHPPPSIIKNP